VGASKFLKDLQEEKKGGQLVDPSLPPAKGKENRYHVQTIAFMPGLAAEGKKRGNYPPSRIFVD